jgi:hypothetical protein
MTVTHRISPFRRISYSKGMGRIGHGWHRRLAFTGVFPSSSAPFFSTSANVQRTFSDARYDAYSQVVFLHCRTDTSDTDYLILQNYLFKNVEFSSKDFGSGTRMIASGGRKIF